MFTSTYRIYYEDTDAGGVVYYANYLKFAERARTDMLRSVDISQTALRDEEGFIFVVRNVELDLKKPARLDDEVNVQTQVTKFKGASMEVLQEIYRKEDNTHLATVNVVIVCVTVAAFKPSKIPPSITDKLQ